MGAHVFNPRNGEAKAGNLFEFEASLLYVEFRDSQGYKIKLSNNIKQTNNHNKIKPTYHSLSLPYLKCLGPEVVWISDSEISWVSDPSQNTEIMRVLYVPST